MKCNNLISNKSNNLWNTNWKLQKNIKLSKIKVLLEFSQKTFSKTVCWLSLWQMLYEFIFWHLCWFLKLSTISFLIFRLTNFVYFYSFDVFSKKTLVQYNIHCHENNLRWETSCLVLNPEENLLFWAFNVARGLFFDASRTPKLIKQTL